MPENKPSKHEPPTLKMVVEEYGKMLEGWKRHTATHEDIDARLQMIQYKVEDTQSACEAMSDIVKGLREEIAQLKGESDGATTTTQRNG